MPGVTRRQRPPLRKNGDALPERIVDYGKRELNVLRDAVDPDAFDDGVDLMSPPGTLAFLGVVHDSVLNLRTFIKAVTISKVV